MTQETQHTQNIENSESIILNDNTLLDSEVWAEMDDTSAEVLRTVEWPNFLKRILGYLDTGEAGAEVNRLDKLRADNDNNVESKKAA